MRYPLIWLAAYLLGGVALPATPAHGLEPAEHPRVAQALRLIEVWLAAQRDYQQIPGISAGIVHDQALLWSTGIGLADRATGRPARPDTIYSICSISKLFTSIGILQLRDAGKIGLDDPIERHLPWFSLRKVHAGSPPITIRGMLTHASGLPRDAAFPYWTGPDFSFPTRAEILATLADQETLYHADNYYQYSNLGMYLLGEIIAEHSGMPYPEYIRRHILDPLGMRDTHTDIPLELVGERLARGYSALTRAGVREPVTLFQAKALAPAAGFASTVEDLAKFVIWQLHAIHARTAGPVLSGNTLREMQRVQWIDADFTNPRGLGFRIDPSSPSAGNDMLVGHGGSCPGFLTQCFIQPQRKIGIIFMVNAQGVDIDQFRQGIYAVIAPALAAAERQGAPAPAPAEKNLQAYLGLYHSGFRDEYAVLEWENSLALLRLPTMNPLGSLTLLRQTAEHTFERVRRDGSPGEPVLFAMGADGRARLFRQFSHYFTRTD
jgi:CubicO group peptidase (beta-lactamase class C family)